MIIVFGSRLFGKVDEIPGIGHVATKFVHLDYFPLVPTESWFIIEQSGNGWRGARVGISAKSILIAWFRVALVLAIVIASITGALFVAGNRAGLMDGILLLAGAVAGIALFIGTYKLRGIGKATPARAEALLQGLGMSQDAITAMMQQIYAEVPAGGFPVVPIRPPQLPPAGTFEIQSSATTQR